MEEIQKMNKALIPCCMTQLRMLPWWYCKAREIGEQKSIEILTSVGIEQRKG